MSSFLPRLRESLFRRRMGLRFVAAAGLHLAAGCALPTQTCHDCPACQQEHAREQAAAQQLARAEQKPSPVPDTAADPQIITTSASENAVPGLAATDLVAGDTADSRLLALEGELRRLQLERRDELTHHKRLQLAVYAMNDRVEQLNAEVHHWQGEVARLEDEAVAQQARDLESMQQLSRMLDELPGTNE